MKLDILGIKNGIVPDPNFDMRRLTSWLASEAELQAKEGLDVQIDWIESDIPLDYSVFIPKNDKYGYDLRGIANLKDKLRTLPIEKNCYHLIYFFYQPDRSVQGLANWTYPNALNRQEAIIEIPVQPEFFSGDRMLDVLKHETIHALHRLCWFNRITTLDDMDNNGGNENNLARIRPYYKTIFQEPLGRQEKTVLKGLIAALTSLIAILSKKQSRLGQWADAIEKMENMDKSYNNPGALRYSPFQEGTRNGYAYFKDYATGRKALVHQLTIAANGKSSVYSPDMSLLDFFAKYAPSSDRNDPAGYASFVANQLKVAPQTKIKELL